MKQKIHFISGLPRSGSTLLSGILRQNPVIHAGITSPVGALFNSMIETMSPGKDYAVLIREEARHDILKGLFESYYRRQKKIRIIFDTNRLWCSRLDALSRLFPESKIICCVRNPAWIMDSIERITRKNSFENSRLFANNSERGNVYTRVEALGRQDRLVGFAWSALREACFSEYGSSILLVEYEQFTKDPKKTLRGIYKFINEDEFEHDFGNVEYDEPEFDRFLGTEGLHKVAKKVEFIPRETILPPDLFDRFNKLVFWEKDSKIKANILF